MFEQKESRVSVELELWNNAQAYAEMMEMPECAQAEERTECVHGKGANPLVARPHGPHLPADLRDDE